MDSDIIYENPNRRYFTVAEGAGRYSSRMVRQLPEEHGIKGRTSKPGYPYDSSCAESFFAGTKNECILRNGYDRMRALSGIFSYCVEISITGIVCTAHWVT